MKLVTIRNRNWRTTFANVAPIIRFCLKGKAIGARARQFAFGIGAELARANCFTLKNGKIEN